MGDKDLAGKALEMHEEVFADIVNTLLFCGEEVISAGDLTDAEPRSQYSGYGKLHEQERDVVKYWNHASLHVARLGIENEAVQNNDMVLRMFGYDGGAYREQLLKDPGKDVQQDSKEPFSKGTDVLLTPGNSGLRYPVISLVLYFGYQHPWTGPLNLKERLSIRDELQPFVNDYHMHLFEIAFLDRETIDKFKSDFWFVADFFWQMREYGTYHGTERDMKHVREVMHMFKALTGDDRFVAELPQKGGKGVMLKFLDELEEKGEKRGIVIGERRGILIGEERGRNQGSLTGETNMLTLVTNLLAAGRTSDIDRMKTDLAYRQQLMEEFGIKTV